MHLGVAFLEGDELLQFGVKTFPGKKTERTLLPKIERFLDELYVRHRPDTLAVEEPFYAQARLSPLLRAVCAAVKRWSRRKRLHTVRFLPTAVKKRLCKGKPTRRALAEAMTDRYWFLESFLKSSHTLRAQQYWQQMFDAVGLGVCAVMDQ